MHYDLTPDELAEFHARFITEYGVSVVGGCCGTSPDHLAAVVGRCRDLQPAERRAGLGARVAPRSTATCPSIRRRRSWSSASGPTPTARSASARRCWTTTGTPRVAMARDQLKEGAHVLDVCVDYTGEDGVADMREVAGRFATQATLPLMLDSTEPAVIETGLQLIAGKPILNSVNLEDGDAPGTRLDRFLTLARTYGAAVVCTCIDTEGQARTAEWKLRAAAAIHRLAIERYGLEPTDLLFDPLVLPLSTGMEESRRDGIETIEGIRRIKAALPGVSHHRRAVERVLRPQPGGPPRPQLGVPARMPAGRPRRRHRPRGPDHAAQQDRPAGGGGLPRSDLRPSRPGPGLRPAPGAARPLRGGLGGQHREGGPHRLAGRAPAGPAHHRRRPRRPRRRPRRGAGQRRGGPRHRQRHPARTG